MSDTTNRYISPVFHENLQTTFEHVNQLIDAKSFRQAKKILLNLHHADLATLIENSSYKNIEKILELLDTSFKPETLLSLSAGAKHDISEILSRKRLARFIDALEIEDAIEAIDDFADDIKNSILAFLSKDTQHHIIEGFTYPDDAAGRIMEKAFIMIQEHWTIGQAIDAVRHRALENDFYAAIVVNNKHKPVGQIMLCALLKHPRNVLVSDVMDKELKIADTHTKLDELSYIFKQYALTVVPVINKIGRLVGTISINNMIYIIEQQTEDELMHLGGVSSHDLFNDLFSTVKHRFPWLFFNLITVCITSVIIDQFNDTIAKFVTLAAIMPIIPSMGGNAGTQTMTVTVRALHNKDLNYSNSMKAIFKELFVCGFNGVILAVIGGAIILFTFSDMELSLVFGAAVIITFLVAGFAGAFIPIFLNRINITDMFGFSSFLALAYVFLI
jgi:magnesium transporter